MPTLLPTTLPPFLSSMERITTRERDNMEPDKTSSHENDKDIGAESYDDPKLSEANFMEVSNAEYALALSTGPQLKATSWRSIQLFLILLVAFMGSMTNGFDGSGRFCHYFADDCYVDTRLQ